MATWQLTRRATSRTEGSSYITEFFEDIGTDCRHDGTTRSGRVSTEDQRNPESSRAWQLNRARALVEPHGGEVVAEFFDIGQSRFIPWQRRPLFVHYGVQGNGGRRGARSGVLRFV